MAAPKASSSNAGKTVTVKSGQTLSSIAKANNTTVGAILKANPKFTEQEKFQNGNMIWSGTTVKIPGKKVTNTSKTEADVVVDAPVYAAPVPQDPVYYSAPVEPRPATPPPPVEVSYTTEQVKVATSNLIIKDTDIVTVEEMNNLIFEDIGGRELISLSRNDLINGDDIDYQPIKNLGEIKEAYNSQNIISLQSTLGDYFRKFPVELDSFIPATGSGPSNEAIYVDSTTGNLVIDLINLDSDLEVEIQVFDSGMILSDTID